MTNANQSSSSILIETNTDAYVARWSCINAGYLKDEFLSLFCESHRPTSPLINRGTWARSIGIDAALETKVSELFENGESRVQIVSLGAGYDTRYFRLAEFWRSVGNVSYIELDLDAVVKNKIDKLKNHTKFLFDNSEYHSTDSSFTCDNYSIYAFDISKLPELYQNINIRLDCATIFLSECCLVYLNKAQDIIQWSCDSINKVNWIIYEPISCDDRFGQIMQENLSKRGIKMPSLQTSVYSYRNYLSRLGLKNCTIETIQDVAEKYEKTLPDSLRYLDEVEEWNMITGHYVLVKASNCL